EPVNGVRNQVELQKSKYASLLADTDRTNSDSLVNQQFRQQYQDAARERNNAQAVENQLALQESKYASLELDKAVAPTLTPQIAPKLATPVLGETPNLHPQGEPVNGVRNQVELQKSKYASLLADTDRTNSDSLVNQQFRQQYQDAARERNNAQAVENQLALQESKYASLELDKAVAPTLTPQIAPKLATPVLGETPNLRPQGKPVNGVRNQVELQKSKYASLLADTDRTNSDSLVNQQFRQQYQGAARERNNAQAVENQLALQESKYASLELDKAVAPTLTPQITPKLATPVLGETPNLRPQGEPELITYEETFTGSIEVAPEGYNIPVEPEDEVPAYLTPEIVKQQAAKLDSVCLTNTQQFVQSSGGTLNTFGGSGNNFQEVKTDLTSDEDRFSYSMEIFAMLQQALADNPDLQQAIAQQHAGASKNSHVKATWTLSMNTGASYTLSTDSSQAYHPSIEVVVNNQGAVLVNDGNGIELARIVSNAQNGDCENASYDVVIANN
ncbi:hypothetical protein KW493_21405, partial [Vibrio fluvialis]|nr:hypothetical protein [Vibrio fluvialis]